MKEYCADEPRFLRETDSGTIQAAIDRASADGVGKVIIPRFNPRTGKPLWTIEKTILIPSDMTVILDGCHIRLADGVRENIFRNSNAWTPEGNTLEGEQHNIRIIGIGNAVLDGGEPNGLCEQMHRDDPVKNPHMQVNLLLFLHNVRHFEVRGFQCRDSRWWATCFMFCRWGKICDLDMRMYGTLENQDGVDIRIGCEYITVENITGITGDDTVALTALPRDTYFEGMLHVEGKSIDIHDITVRNIISSTHGCGIVRLLCEHGAREYNIKISDITDTGETIGGAAVLIGISDPVLAKEPHKMGDFKNIFISNVTTSSQRVMSIREPTENLYISNVISTDANEMGFAFDKNFVAKNVHISNFTFGASPENADCVFWFGCGEEGIKDLTISNVRASKAKHVFRGRAKEISNFSYEEPSEGFLNPDRPRLTSAYGRYHRFAYGKLIENRPPDSRYNTDGSRKK